MQIYTLVAFNSIGWPWWAVCCCRLLALIVDRGHGLDIVVVGCTYP